MQDSRPDHASNSWIHNDLTMIAGFALLKVLLHLPVLGRYGYHIDELYFIACGDHPAFGYVDHAPLVPWIARLATGLFGESLHGLRIASTLAGGLAVFLAGLLARRLGGGRFAQAITCIAMIIAPVYLRTGNMFAIPSFEPVYWLVCYHLLVGILQNEDRPGFDRRWLWLGLAIGVGLLNKHTMLFFAAGLTGALLLTPDRRLLTQKGPYLAAVISLLVFLPNLLWQVAHGWPTVGFIVDLNAGVMSRISIGQFLFGQFLYLNPINAVLWIWGLWCLLRSPDGREYRVLGWIWVLVFVLLALAKSKIYYLAPAYPPLLAAGAIALERSIQRSGRRWLRPVAVGLLVLNGLALMPMSVPVLSLQATETWVRRITLGKMENIHELTGDLRNMHGWEEKASEVARIYDSLTPEERERTIIWGAGYGNPGAIDLFGPQYGLPKAYSITLSYWMWGPPPTADIVIAMGIEPDDVAHLYDDARLVASLELENVGPWDTPFPITVCREPKHQLHDIWQRNRPW